MERPKFIEGAKKVINNIALEVPSIRVNRWGFANILAMGSLLLAGCDRSNTPTIASITPLKPVAGDFVNNEPNAQGHYAESAQPGTCAPFNTPKWEEYNQLQVRCVDPSGALPKDVRGDVKGPQGKSISVKIGSPWDSSTVKPITVEVPYGQALDNIQNPVNGNCRIKVVNVGRQPQVGQVCY